MRRKKFHGEGGTDFLGLRSFEEDFHQLEILFAFVSNGIGEESIENAIQTEKILVGQIRRSMEKSSHEEKRETNRQETEKTSFYLFQLFRSS